MDRPASGSGWLLRILDRKSEKEVEEEWEKVVLCLGVSRLESALSRRDDSSSPLPFPLPARLHPLRPRRSFRSFEVQGNLLPFFSGHQDRRREDSHFSRLNQSRRRWNWEVGCGFRWTLRSRWEGRYRRLQPCTKIFLLLSASQR